MIATILLIINLAVALGMTFAKHNEPKTGKHNGWVSLAAALTIAGLYYWAGLFDVFKIGG